MSVRNSPIAFNASWLTPSVDLSEKCIAEICAKCETQAAEDAKITANLLSIIGNIDLTTLSAVDTAAKVTALTSRAIDPLSAVAKASLSPEQVGSTHCAAVCVYPSRVADVKRRLVELSAEGDVSLASVAGGFPSGMYRLESRLLEIQLCIDDGANEIDTVINRPMALEGRWNDLYNELRRMREQCAELAHLKTILAVGELVDCRTVYAASMTAMMAGSDFIKTSTGKEALNATLSYAYVMCVAISDFYKRTGVQVGFKPAGGISSPSQAFAYRRVVETILGAKWTTPKLFRLGASSALDNIVAALEK